MWDLERVFCILTQFCVSSISRVTHLLVLLILSCQLSLLLTELRLSISGWLQRMENEQFIFFDFFSNVYNMHLYNYSRKDCIK